MGAANAGKRKYMSNSANLGLPFIEAAQAQKHVTHNEAIRGLDVLVQLSVIDRDLNVPPASPLDGDRYLVANGASGNWLGQDTNIAGWQDGNWAFYTPKAGWLCWVDDEDSLISWDGTAWVDALAAMGAISNLDTLGINATPDLTNRLTVSSPAVLLNHEGAGHQLKINKNTATDTASLLFQTGTSGRAEMGLAGDDDYHFKVSSDGVNWSEAIVIDRTTGGVTFPNTTISGGGSAGLGTMLFWAAN